MSNYAEITQEIIDNAKTSSDGFIANLPNFVRKAELQIFRDVDLRAWREHATTQLARGTGYITLPLESDLIIRRLFLLKLDGSYLTLIPKNYDWLRDYWPNKVRLGTPKFYSHWSTDIISIAPPPDQNYQAEIEYSALPVSLVDGGLPAQAAFTVALLDGGQGYVVGDVLTLLGGEGTPTQVTVSSVAGGVVQAVTISTPGAYFQKPVEATSFPISVNGGSGISAVLQITAYKSVNSNETYLSNHGYDALVSCSMIWALRYLKGEMQSVGETLQGQPGEWDRAYAAALQRLVNHENRERVDDVKNRIPG